MLGARITDEVDFQCLQGNERAAVRAVRKRSPDNFRWRAAVKDINKEASTLRGLPRLRIVEPIREAVLDIGKRELKREVVLDARRLRVDLDRGEVLPVRRVLDLRRYAYIMGTDLRLLQHYLHVPENYRAAVDTAGVVLVSRSLSNHYRKRAQKIWLDLPQEDSSLYRQHHRYLANRAQHEMDLARRWAALAREVLGEAPKPPSP